MGLILNIISKKMYYYEFFLNRKEYAKAFWQFYCAVNFSEAYLGVENTEEQKRINRIRNKLWIKWCDVDLKDNSKILKRFQELINRDMKIVIEAMDKLQREVDIAEVEEGQGIYRSGDIAVPTFDFPE